MNEHQNWVIGHEAWKSFTQARPDLRYSPSQFGFNNFLRYHRDSLVAAGVLRKCKNKFWVADTRHFNQAAFDAATGAFANTQ
jgi:hypothetical protein